MLSNVVFVLAAMVGQADGEKVFQSYAELAVDGVWTSTIDDQKLEHSYRRLDGNRFIQLKGKGGLLQYTAIVGVDPESKKCTWWCFTEDGGVGKGLMNQESDGVWILQMSGVTPNGKYNYKGRISRVDENTLKEEVSQFTVAGKDAALPPMAIWKRSR